MKIEQFFASLHGGMTPSESILAGEKFDAGFVIEFAKQWKRSKPSKKAVDPCYGNFVDQWTKAYPELGFGAMAGNKIKSIIAQARAIVVGNGKEPSTEMICAQFAYVINYVNTTNHWLRGKSISVWDSKYRELYFEIKNGKTKPAAFKSRASETRDFLNSL